MQPRFKKRLLQITALAAAVGISISAQAHRAWLLPSSTVLSGESPWITVDAAVSNDLFYFEHFPLRLEGVGASDAHMAGAPLQIIAPDGSKAEPQNGAVGRYRSTFDVQLTQEGTYKIAVVRGGGLFASYTENGERKRWRGTTETFAREVPQNAADLQVTQSDSRIELFVTAGNPTESVFTPTGKGLELKPVTHPNDLFAEEKAEFQLLLDGTPARDVEVTVIRGGKRYRNQLEEITTTSDGNGMITVEWPQAGMYWLEAEIETGQGVTAPATSRRASYIATLEVLPQ